MEQRGQANAALWEAWVSSSLGDLQQRNLLRAQRPTIPLLSSSEALISQADLDAWVNGTAPAPNFQTVAAWRSAAIHSSSNTQLAQPSWNSCSGSASASCSSSTTSASAGVGPSTSFRKLKLFSLNDYLGLASHQDVCSAAASAALAWGNGPRSSGIVGGTTAVHRELEEALADLKGTEDCLLTPTGFAANMSVVTALASTASSGSPSSSSLHPSHTSVAILSDELNHASIIDGARLATRGSTGGGTSLHVYRHNDMGHLEEILQALPRHTRALVVTDSLFSMDGDFADLRALAALRARYGFMLAVDEAHATLVCGDKGGGAAEALGVADQVDVHIGTLSKAFGSLGGFVATSRQLKQLILNKGRSYVYSTALPLPAVSAAQAAIAVSRREAWRRSHVWALVDRLGSALGVPALSPVVPLVVGSEQAALTWGSRLLSQGMHVPAIRPPTVPPGTCRLRVSLSAAHSFEDVDALVEAIKAGGASLMALPHLIQQQSDTAFMSALRPSSCSSPSSACMGTTHAHGNGGGVVRVQLKGVTEGGLECEGLGSGRVGQLRTAHHSRL